MGRAVLPLGSHEDHGALPPDTDTRIAQCLASRIAAQSGWDLLPAVPYGFSPEHSPAAIWIDAQTYMSMLRSLLLTSGHESVLVVNGHGGNSPLVRAVSFELVAYTAAPVSVEVLDVWSAVSSMLGLRGAIVHAGPVEASLASACGVEPRGYVEVDEESALGRTGAEEDTNPSTEAPWRSSDLPEPRREYSRSLGERVADALVEAALRGPRRGSRL
ncbi:creatininase family protein [Conexivisphaera calida]|uniref:Creatinine amidohydrolase n=1 Tax=Conexivisphaera calida TaxID=1874277 RepID=A0A4P2VLB7_9ARCH|nr:creatininase family protein [Conexivisphaera calida]BBE41965.1 Creatinine amidohydrolase [Conexivisphaera calida]